MSKTNYTPAPWAVDINTNHAHEAETIRGADNVRIAATYKIHEHRADKMGAYYETRANARLIAAAPELLEALQDAEFLLRKAGQLAGAMQDSFNRSAADARAAIAKATGGEQ